MRKLLLISVFISFVGVSGSLAQHDVYYSQFYAAPITLNPAYSGAIESDLRAFANYRNQWSSFSGGFQTYGAGIDTKLELDEKTHGNNFVGVGFNVYSDNAGSNNFNSTKVAGSGSYAIDVGGTPDRPHFIAVGFQLGFLQRTFDPGSSTWGNQWVGTGFDQQIPSNENTTTKFTEGVFDVGAGATWYNWIDSQKRLVLGASILHANRPKVGFVNQDERLYRRYVFSGQFWLASKDGKVTLWPAVLYQRQGPSQSLTFGGEVQFEVQERTEHTNFRDNVSLGGGAYYRYDDSVYFVGRLNYHDFSLGLSYDITTSDLTVANNGQGGFEVIIGYRPRFDGSGTNRQKLGDDKEL